MGLIKGYYFESDIDIVRRKLGDEGVKKLEKEHGSSIHYLATKDYPEEEEAKLIRSICRVIWGNDGPKEHIEVGKETFRSYVNNPIGKTMMKLFGGNPERIVRNLPKIWNTFSTGVDVEVVQIEQSQATVLFEHSPFPPEYYEGIFLGGLDRLGYRGETHHTAVGEDGYQIQISWE